MKKIDLDSWKRKAQYDFFKDFEDPFFSATTNIKCTNCYTQSKTEGKSFFASYMHKSLQALNEIEEFRLRIVENEVFEFEKIHGTTTVFKEDETFSFCYFEYCKNFNEFEAGIQLALKNAKSFNHLISKPEIDLVYVSVIPWRSFTCIKHPRQGKTKDSVPRVVYGKVFQQGKDFYMPVSVDAHHSLVDGFHVSKFFNRFEELLMNT